MAGYTRQSAANIVNGAVVNASDHNAEYNAIEAAFNATTGHTHDGTTGGGAKIVTNSITDSAVTTAKIADVNVTTAKVADNAVTNAKIADMAQNTIKGRITASTGDPEDLTPAQARTVIGSPNIAGDVFTGAVGHTAGTTSAPGSYISGDTNTGIAQVGGADTISTVAGGQEVIRSGVNSAKVYGAFTVGDRGDGFGSALTLTPGAGPDWHIYSRVSDGALVFYHFKNKAGGTVASETVVFKESGVVDFSSTPTVSGSPIGGSGLFTGTTSKSSNYTVVSGDNRYLVECTAGLTLSLTAAATLASGFTFAVWNNSTGTVIVDPNSSELINGAATLTLLPGQWAFITCTGSAWKALTQTSQSTCTWSSTDKESSLIITNSGLTASVASGGAMQSGRATTALSGQKYFEVAVDVVAASGLTAIVGMATAAAAFGSSYGLATSANGYGFASDTGNKLNNSSQSAYSSAWNTAGYVVGIAFDDVSTPGTTKIWLSINGVWQASGNPVTGANPAFSVTSSTFYPAITCKNGGQVTARFTASSWSYSAPAGFTQIS